MDEDISPSKKIQLHDSNFYENTILSPASMFLTNVNVMTGSAKHLENAYLAPDSVSSNESYRDLTQTYPQQRYSTHSCAPFSNGNCYHHQSQQYEYNDNSATSSALRCAQNNGNELYTSTDYTTCHRIGSSSSSSSISISSNRNNNNGNSKNNDKNSDDSIININNLNDHDTVTRPPPPPPPPPHHHHHIHAHGANYFYYERCNNNNNNNNNSSSHGTDEDYILSSSSSSSLLLQKKPIVKRRNTANRKERRRTLSINNAFADLRDCIPNVPTDTKLSKIKTLRLATSYIGYLLEVLNSNDPVESFKVDLSSHTNKKTLTNLTSYYENTNTNARCSRIHLKTNPTMVIAENAYSGHLQPAENTKKSKGRTGWPQHVWALELKQEQL